MTLSETLASAEGRIHDVVESGRTRLRAVVDDAEKRVQENLPRVREQLELWQDRSFEDAERIGGYVTQGLRRIGGRLPKIELPFSSRLPGPEELVIRWFDATNRAVALQRKLALDWIGAVRTAHAKKATEEEDRIHGTA
jgi:hypothetical protein